MKWTCSSNAQGGTCGVRHQTAEAAKRHSLSLNNLHNHPRNRRASGYCMGCSGSYLDYTPAAR